MFIHDHDLIDIGSFGNPFTWHNRRQNNSVVFARLNRAVANHRWLSLYPQATLINYLIFGSDHEPILLNLDNSGKIYNNINNRFKFEAKWLLNDAFFYIVKNVWANHVNGSPAFQLAKKTYMLQKAIKIWQAQVENEKSNSTFTSLLRDLETTQRDIIYNPMDDRLWLQDDYTRKIHKYAMEQEIY